MELAVSRFRTSSRSPLRNTCARTAWAFCSVSSVSDTTTGRAARPAASTPSTPAASWPRAAASAAGPARSAPPGSPRLRVALSAMSELWVAHLGQVPYREAVALQEIVRERRQADEIADALLVLEHPPVYTKGRRTEPSDLPMGEDWYRLQGIEVEPSD